MILNDTIVAPATPSGGAIAVVRVEGENAITITEGFVRLAQGRKLSEMKG